MTKIYTKTGDRGRTGLGSGSRVYKDDLIVAALGELDELNSVLGLVRAQGMTQFEKGMLEIITDLGSVQKDLFLIGACLGGGSGGGGLFRRTGWLEEKIDQIDRELPGLKNFIFPSGHLVATGLFWARAVCRRTERTMVGLIHRPGLKKTTVFTRGQKNNYLIIEAYLNRLADYLFVLGRWVNLKMGFTEEKWKSAKFTEKESAK